MKPENAALPGRLGILPWTSSAQCSPCLNTSCREHRGGAKKSWILCRGLKLTKPAQPGGERGAGLECVREERDRPGAAVSVDVWAPSAPLGPSGGAAAALGLEQPLWAGLGRAGLRACQGLAFRDWLSIPASSTTCNSLGINWGGSTGAVELPVCCLQRRGTSACVRSNPWSGVRFPLIAWTLYFSLYRLCHLPFREMQPGRG